MTPSGITLATATPRPLEPWDDTDTKFGTRQRIWHYGPNQQTRRHWDANRGKKKVQPFIGIPDKPTEQWMCHAGHEPWPHYWSHPTEDAFRSLWVLEGEGEKVADYAASEGFVGISHPGHDRSDEAIQRRYRQLKPLVAGVVYLSDADPQGIDLGQRCRDAAAAVGLPFIDIEMGVLFPDLPKGGSLDDVPDVGAAIQHILDAVNEEPPAQQPSQENCAEPANPATTADPEDLPAEAPLRRRYEAQLVLKAYANQARGLQAKTYYMTQEARDIYIPWFQAHQRRAQQLEGSSPIVSSVLDKSSAQFLRMAGLLHLVRYPGRDRIDATTATLAMEVIDCLFAETELFHRGDGDLVDQLMDRIRGLRGEVTWERLRAKGLNRWLKENAKTRHFSEAVSNLIANAEGQLVKTYPVTWRR